MVIFTARHNLPNLNEVKINLIVKFANLAGKSYIIPCKMSRCAYTGRNKILRKFTCRILLIFFPLSDCELRCQRTKAIFA